MNNKISSKKISLDEYKIKNKLNYKKYNNCSDKRIIYLIDDDYIENNKAYNKIKQDNTNSKDVDNSEYILNIIEKTKFLTPNMLTSIYNTNSSLEDNNFSLLKLASAFGGPLLKTTYSVIDSKYVYTNKNSYINKATLDGFNKASYLLCSLNNNIKEINISDIETQLNYDNDKFYTLIKVTLIKNTESKKINIILNSSDLEYYKDYNDEMYLNIENIGYLLKRVDIILNKIFSK